MAKCLFVVLCLLVLSVKGDINEEEEVPSEDPVVKEEDDPPFSPPSRPPGDVYFFENFADRESFNKNWIKSKATKSEDDSAKYTGEWEVTAPYFVGANKQDLGLVMPEANRLYAISTKLERTYDFTDNEFVVQFEVNFQDGLNCGGAYVKLLSSDPKLDLAQFRENTPYSIMFGPDKCGQTSKIHFIVRFKNPVTGEIEEKHSKQPTSGLDFFNDRLTHLFTLFIRNDDFYSVSVDHQVLLTGYLTSDLTPGVIPSKEIDDPDDKKPSDWDDKEKIPQPDAVKPDDWDEDAPKTIVDADAVKPEDWLDDGPETIPDPDASKPDDWDDEEDGEWEAPTIANPVCEEVGCGEWVPPTIPNPEYKGKWSPPMIDNPNYMGIWKPRKIPNPGYFELEGTVFSKLTPISALGFELWTVGKGIHFDNVIVTSEITSASALARETWINKSRNEEKATGSGSSITSWVDYFIDVANDRPYLWALYAVGLVLPFVLCAACCVKSKPSSTRPSDETSRRKKTDEQTQDDAPPKGEKTDREDESFVAPAEDEEVNDKKDDIPKEEKVEEKEDTVRQRKGKSKQQPTEEEEQVDEEEFTPRKSPRRGGGSKKAKATKRED